MLKFLKFQRVSSFFPSSARPQGVLSRYFSEDVIVEDAEEMQKTPDMVRLLPISRHPVFPKHPVRFKLGSDHFKFLVQDKHSHFAGAFVVKPKEATKDLEDFAALSSILPVNDLENLYLKGCLASTKFNKFDKTIMLKPSQRVRLLEVVEPVSESIPFPLVKIEPIPDLITNVTNEEDQAMLKVLSNLLEELRGLLSMHELSTLEMFSQNFNMRFDTDYINYVGVLLSYMCELKKIQNIFEPDELSMRIKLTTELVQEQLQLRNSIKKLHSEAQEKMSKASEEHMYKEILGLVKNKLGHDKDEKETLKAKFLKNLEGKKVPDHIKKIIDEEMEKFLMTDKNSSEFHVIRNYLDWLTILPYGVSTQETLDLSKAREILERDHYGMKDVKERILEFIAVSKLRGSSTGKILCFAGPPGVGKTSIAKSIAEALNRTYFRISVGGLDDSAELKGHRRTYVGAQPGKIINALKTAGTENAVILIDEIDKIGQRTYQGSPENTLLEILDPVQNSNFTDHYLDTSIDLSKILFLCTANFPDDINPVLMDRMDVIQVQGYTNEEKKMIFERHLFPQLLQKCSLNSHSEKIDFSEDAKNLLIKDYCREAGVRSLQKVTTRVLEKIARKIVEGHDQVIQVNKENLTEFAGRPKYSEKKMYKDLPPGVVVGLAYTTHGGSVMYIEITRSRFSGEETEGKVQTTGNIKQVMAESVQIAYTYAKSFATSKGNNFLDKHSIHIHCPEGAAPKDGPSAGVTLTTGLLSLAFNKSILKDLAMTGEISLTGKVLPIGGLKEKIIAAKREGVTTVIIPKSNKHNWEELHDELKVGINPHFVEDYQEIFDIVFSQD
jgi:Lon-like ATP-dependent protease